MKNWSKLSDVDLAKAYMEWWNALAQEHFLKTVKKVGKPVGKQLRALLEGHPEFFDLIPKVLELRHNEYKVARQPTWRQAISEEYYEEHIVRRGLSDPYSNDRIDPGWKDVVRDAQQRNSKLPPRDAGGDKRAGGAGAGGGSGRAGFGKNGATKRVVE